MTAFGRPQTLTISRKQIFERQVLAKAASEKECEESGRNCRRPHRQLQKQVALVETR